MKAKPSTNAFTAPIGHLASGGPLIGAVPGRGLTAMQRANRNPMAAKSRCNALTKPIKSPMDYLWGIK